MRPSGDKAHRWDPARYTHMWRVTWEDIDPDPNGGCNTRMRWRLKQSKKDSRGEKRFEKTLSVDRDRSSISAGFAISCMLHKRGYRDDWDHINTRLFEDPDTGKEITTCNSRKMLETNVSKAVLSPKHAKGNSVIIGAQPYTPTHPR